MQKHETPNTFERIHTFYIAVGASVKRRKMGGAGGLERREVPGPAWGWTEKKKAPTNAAAIANPRVFRLNWTNKSQTLKNRF